jgi:hypothetical protein
VDGRLDSRGRADAALDVELQAGAGDGVGQQKLAADREAIPILHVFG